MKFLLLVAIASAALPPYVLGAKSSSSNRQSINVAPTGPSAAVYSQPIPVNYGVPVPGPGARQEVYAYSQPMVASASTQNEYYQAVETPMYSSVPSSAAAAYGYPRQAAYYEPVPQASGSGGHHHSAHYPIKRGHGWHPHAYETNILFIALPLILIPLLLLWPYFVYAASHHQHPVVYAAGWKRSGDGKAATVTSASEDAKNLKVDELTDKILPKLES